MLPRVSVWGTLTAPGAGESPAEQMAVCWVLAGVLGSGVLRGAWLGGCGCSARGML